MTRAGVASLGDDMARQMTWALTLLVAFWLPPAKAEVIGAWRAGDDLVFRIVAAGAEKRRLPDDPADIRRQIEQLESDIQALIPDIGRVDGAERRIAEREARIEALRARLGQSGRRPGETEQDPVGLGRIRADPAARTVRVEVDKEGCAYAFEDAWFDGNVVVARRTHDRECTLDETLPPKVRAALVAGWSPPQWLRLEIVGRKDGSATELKGGFWGLKVAYGRSSLEISRIFDPYQSEAVVATRSLGNWAYGAARDALP